MDDVPKVGAGNWIIALVSSMRMWVHCVL